MVMIILFEQCGRQVATPGKRQLNSVAELIALIPDVWELVMESRL